MTHVGRIRGPIGFCDDPQTGTPVPAGPCSVSPGHEGVHIAYKNDQDVCFFQGIRPNPDGSCQTGYFSTGETCSLIIQDPLPDGSCTGGYHNIRAPVAGVPAGSLCKLNVLELTNDDITTELPGGTVQLDIVMISGTHTQLKCFRKASSP